MSIYAKAFSSYLAETFYPVCVTFISKPIIYSNQLFSVTHKLNNKTNKNDKNDKNDVPEFIKFDLALNNNVVYKNLNNKIKTPESFLKYILDRPSKPTFFELSKYNNLYKFNTDGLIPLRYIDIFNDFSSNKLYYDKPTQNEIKMYEDKILEKISNISDNILLDIFKYADYLSVHDKYMKIKIKFAPYYPFDNDFLETYYNNSWRNPITHSEACRLINQRYWYSGDGDMSSPSTKIFFNRSSKLSSLCNIGYKKLFSSSGGINMSYAEKLPWFKLRYMFNNRQIYYDLPGQDFYHSYTFDITEFIVFSEVLAKEGTDYYLEID
jgi:hypothetical protein